MSVPYKKVHVIINPAAGKYEPILNTINKVFHKYEIDWQVSITKKFGDATRLAKQAIAAGVDLVAGYGGDGTQMEIANAVIGGNADLYVLYDPCAETVRMMPVGSSRVELVDQVTCPSPE